MPAVPKDRAHLLPVLPSSDAEEATKESERHDHGHGLNSDEDTPKQEQGADIGKPLLRVVHDAQRGARCHTESCGDAPWV
jgi:hypothetical protein